MNKYLVLSFFIIDIAYAGAVQPAKYSIANDTNISYIFPSDSSMDIARVSKIHRQIILNYEKSYGYKLDQRMFTTLASSKDQIANGFSTQFPLNEQVFYGGGVQYVDYFSSVSWLKTLLIHETAHNFQLNPKENVLSKIAHKISGNAMVISPLFIPFFTAPNIMESRYILEGNAVLNESLWGNGGRLYSGYALAEVVTQARAGRITPKRVYNYMLEFPYGEKLYLVGGHFQKFLARKFGVDRVNRYFKVYARQPFPFFSNSVFRRHYGKDFVELTKEFRDSILREHRGFRASKGEVLAYSKIPVPLERSGDKIFTLISDKRSAPNLMQIDTASGKVTYTKGSWRAGRVFEKEGRYYTQSSAKTSPGQISMGLFDKNGYIKKGTVSKVMQGWLSDGREVYFDVAKSWDQPHLYVGGKFYSVVNSSVYIDGSDVYYFKQSDKMRYLYKNRQRLFGYKGYYGTVMDVDSVGRVYFVAPSEHGSTVYRVTHGKLERVTSGDDVIGFKYLGSNQAIVQTITADGYQIRQCSIHPVGAKVAVYNLGLPQNRMDDPSDDTVGMMQAKSYFAPMELRFASLSSTSSYTSYDGYSLIMSANFTDPLWQNTLKFTMKYQRQRTLLGASYSNNATLLHWGGGITAIKKHKGYDNSSYRDIGYSAYLSLPFLATGYWSGSVLLAYSKPYDDIWRKPLSISGYVMYKEQHGISKYPNSYFGISAFAENDRGVVYSGVSGNWMQDLDKQTYVEFRGKYMYSQIADSKRSMGIKIGESSPSGADKAVLNIPTLSDNYYIKKVAMAGVGLYKVFDYSWYSYHFPISIARESIYLKHNLYALQTESGKNKTIHESIAGIEADLMVQPGFVLPVSLELLYNKDAYKKVQIRARASYSF